MIHVNRLIDKDVRIFHKNALLRILVLSDRQLTCMLAKLSCEVEGCISWDCLARFISSSCCFASACETFKNVIHENYLVTCICNKMKVSYKIPDI